MANFSKNKIVKIKNYTTKANRYFCNICSMHFCMIYKDSQNVWISTDVFDFEYKNILQYDIFKS